MIAMEKTFKFNNYKTALNEITIPAVGDFVIEAINEDDQFYYYLLVKTYLGTTNIYWYGPIIPDINELLDKYSCNYFKMSYNEKKLNSFIDKWLNDSKKKISAVNIITATDFINNIKDISLYI